METIEINLWEEKSFALPEDRKVILKEVKKDKEKFIKCPNSLSKQARNML